MLSPGGELYTNLERGVIDATEWIGPYHDYLMGFHKIARYYYSPGWHEAGTVLETLVNKRDFENLGPDLQEIVRTANYRLNTFILSELEASNNAHLKKIMEESEVEILKFPSEVLNDLKTYSEEIYTELIEQSELSKKAYDSFFTFKNNMTQWSEWSEKVFYNEVQ